MLFQKKTLYILPNTLLELSNILSKNDTNQCQTFSKNCQMRRKKIVKSYLMKQKGQIGTQRLDPNAV